MFPPLTLISFSTDWGQQYHYLNRQDVLTMSRYPGMLVCLNLIFPTIPSSSYPSPSSSLLPQMSPLPLLISSCMALDGNTSPRENIGPCTSISIHPLLLLPRQAVPQGGRQVQTSARTLHLASSTAASLSPSMPTLMLSPSDTDVVVNNTDDTGIVRATPKPASSMAHSTVTRALALWAHT